MIPHSTRRRILVCLTILMAAAIGAVAHLAARAHAATSSDPRAAKSAGPGARTGSSEQELMVFRRQIEQAERQISRARAALNQIMFERIKSIKKRRGLTPKQAKAFDDAYAAELARVNEAQQRVDAARRELAAREAALQKATRVTAALGSAGILARLEDLERRVTILEMTVGK